MFELLSVIVFVWLLIKAISLALKLTWGMAKIIAGILIVDVYKRQGLPISSRLVAADSIAVPEPFRTFRAL